MPTLEQARLISDSYSPTYFPTAIFIGGTSGIGQAMAEAFARATSGNCHIVLVGTGRAAAESIIASFPKPTTINPKHQPTHEFVECDASRMKDIHATTASLLARLSKLNFLIVSPELRRFTGRHETEDGLDETLALAYYARWSFINDLMPLLRKAKDTNQDAKVMSILAGGSSSNVEIDLNDLGMVKNYGVFQAMNVASAYNDMMLEKFSAQEPDIAFTHIYPGFVLAPGFFPSVFPLRLLNPLIFALLWPFSVSQARCAEYMWCAMHDVDRGFFRRGERGDDLKFGNYRGTPEARDALWAHTQDATRVKFD